MPTRAVSFDTVRELGLALPNTEEGTSFGAPALKVGGKMFACVPTHRSAEPRSLAVRVSFEDRDYLLASDPDTFYVKPHYVGYPCVLVRLDRVKRAALRDLLQVGWEFMSTDKRRKGRR
jgi:hypothetical protein